MSDAQVRVATANEALSAMKQASPVRPHDAQRSSCSGVVDTAASLQQRMFSEAPTKPLSPDRQPSRGIGATRSPPLLSQSPCRGFPHQVRIDESANEVVEIRAQGRGRPVNYRRQVHALPEGALPDSVPMSKEEREKHDKWLEEQLTKKLEGEDGQSSPEYVTDD